MISYKRQDYGDWLQQNPNGKPLEYFEEQIRKIDFDLKPYFSALHSKEEKDFLEEEKEDFLARIQKVKWAKIARKELEK